MSTIVEGARSITEWATQTKAVANYLERTARSTRNLRRAGLPIYEK
jgi:hypothetical protein